MVDPKTFYLNLLLILTAVVFSVVLFFVMLAAVTLIRAGLWARKRRRAEKKWLKASRRADGRRYPATFPGTCDLCRRGSRYIYQEYGKQICPGCYESYWRKVEGWTDGSQVLATNSPPEPITSSEDASQPEHS